MATCRITEYQSATIAGPGLPVQAGMEPSLTVQNVSFTTSTESAAFDAKTKLVRVKADAQCHVKFGPAGQTAAATDTQLEANVAEYFGVVPGQVVAIYDGVS